MLWRAMLTLCCLSTWLCIGSVNDVETYLVVMRNVFSPRLSIHKKYDVKGSTVDRSASEKERVSVPVVLGISLKC
ncbi:phosphatidylinositol 5 phosphate 4 kinase type 2 [Plakobranchus ocellatus]|uniref:Phosphatidylinositol 5 phosphate 4 kinase type 2 n=1 Tax=Plakobranchus ocellatus TaxID=259542 RepID=A0AAV4BW60_9GAST|nr:phosphatidylinositol 5 phosphate 4 kinase type 2 [Plakobranchus ocellatus]